MAGRARKRSKIFFGFNTKTIVDVFVDRLNTTINSTQARFKKRYKKVIRFIDRKPLTSFFATLGILLILIIIGSLLARPQEEIKKPEVQKEVKIYSIGETPRISFQASIEKTGVIKIVAQTPGIVQFINVVEGQNVAKGTTLLGLSTNYAGANVATYQRKLAEIQYQNAQNSYELQKEVIKKQREAANQTDTNQDELRKISEESLESSRQLLNLNESILTTLNEQQKQLEATNIGGANDQLILSTKQLISQLEGGTNQLRITLKTNEYSVNTNNPPTKLSGLQKELTHKQLDLELKSLDLNLDISRIQLQIARVNESLNYPHAPFSATVERIHVIPQQSVNPGTELITLHGNQTIKAVAKVPRSIAQNISRIESSTIHINQTVLETTPSYITSEATDGNLYAVIFDIETSYQNQLTNNEFVTIELPIGYPGTNATIPYIPLDAIYQSQDKSYVYINENGIAKAKTVKLGPVLGQYVEVTQGLTRGNQIILDRTVVAEDKVKVKI